MGFPSCTLQIWADHEMRTARHSETHLDVLLCEGCLENQKSDLSCMLQLNDPAVVVVILS